MFDICLPEYDVISSGRQIPNLGETHFLCFQRNRRTYVAWCPRKHCHCHRRRTLNSHTQTGTQNTKIFLLLLVFTDAIENKINHDVRKEILI